MIHYWRLQQLLIDHRIDRMLTILLNKHVAHKYCTGRIRYVRALDVLAEVMKIDVKVKRYPPSITMKWCKLLLHPILYGGQSKCCNRLPSSLLIPLLCFNNYCTFPFHYPFSPWRQISSWICQLTHPNRHYDENVQIDLKFLTYCICIEDSSVDDLTHIKEL